MTVTILLPVAEPPFRLTLPGPQSLTDLLVSSARVRARFFDVAKFEGEMQYGSTQNAKKQENVSSTKRRFHRVCTINIYFLVGLRAIQGDEGLFRSTGIESVGSTPK
jgi:hypothetical protein